MATFITRQSIEGDQLITNENVGTGCWTDGNSQYIPNSLILVINGTDYPVATPSFFGFGYFHCQLPDGLVLKAGDKVRLKSACSADDSLEVTTLPINLKLTTSNATTCNNTAPIHATYSDRVRLFLQGDAAAGEVFNLSANGTWLNTTDFFRQIGSLGNATSANGDWTPDAVNSAIYFTNNLFDPATDLKVEVINSDSYFTVRLGYIEVIFEYGTINIIDYINGAELNDLAGGYANGDTFTINSTPTTYAVLKNGISFYSVQKSVDYILPGGAGSIAPDPSVAGVDSTWTLPTQPGNYKIQVKLGDQITAEAVATVAACQLSAENHQGSAAKGSVDNAVPALTGTAPNNCSVDGFKIKSLPVCGTLKLNGTVVAIGQTIAAADAGKLKLDVPANCAENQLTFTYSSFCNLPGCQESAAATITIALQDGTADSRDDASTGPKGAPIVHNISSNDVDCSVGNTFFELVAGSAQNGAVTSFNQGTGEATFSPSSPGYVGPAEYKYNIRCGLTFADSVVKDTSTVKLFFYGGSAADDTGHTYRDKPVNGSVASNDTATCQGPVTYILLPGSAVNGTVTSFDTATGAYTFLPEPGFVGAAQFKYNLLCNGQVIGTATVRITVDGGVLAPDQETTAINTPIISSVPGNDTFVCQDPVSFALKAGSEYNGKVTAFDPVTGIYTFTPAANYTGEAGFIYEAFCGTVKVGETTVRIMVLPSCDICAELKAIKLMLQAMKCDIYEIKKYIRVS